MSTIYYDIECDFTQIPNHIILNPEISGTAKAIYFYIVMRLRQNAKWEFYDFDIMEHLKEGRDSFRNAKKELLEYGYLVKVKQNIGNDGKYKGCDYAIKKEPITENPTSVKPKTDEPISENPSANNKKQNNNINNKQSKKDNTNTASGVSNKKEIPVVKENLTTQSVEVEVAEIDSKQNIDLFEAFWKAYPKKKAKEKARQVFEKLLSKAKNKEILAEQIMKGLELYNQEIMQKQTKEEFIAHATTWLNQARWEDEYKTPQQNKINLSGQKLIQKPVYEVSEEDKKKQEQELKEYAKVKTEKSQFMEHFKSVLKNYFGSSHFSWIQSLKIKSTNENEVVFMLQCQIYVDVITRNKEKFEQVFNREFQGFGEEFTGKVKFVAWKI